MVLALWPHPHKTVYGDPITHPIKTVKVKPIAESPLQPQTALVSVPTAPVVIYTVPTYPVGTSGYCGDNMYKQYIYSHESGCDTGRWNTSGCVGIGQACPASKLLAVCPNLDFACEDAFFTAYANAAYGGWAGAYQAWLQKSWW